jgi:hypothetical protein
MFFFVYNFNNEQTINSLSYFIEVFIIHAI